MLSKPALFSEVVSQLFNLPFVPGFPFLFLAILNGVAIFDTCISSPVVIYTTLIYSDNARSHNRSDCYMKDGCLLYAISIDETSSWVLLIPRLISTVAGI